MVWNWGAGERSTPTTPDIPCLHRQGVGERPGGCISFLRESSGFHNKHISSTSSAAVCQYRGTAEGTFPFAGVLPGTGHKGQAPMACLPFRVRSRTIPGSGLGKPLSVPLSPGPGQLRGAEAGRPPCLHKARLGNMREPGCPPPPKQGNNSGAGSTSQLTWGGGELLGLQTPRAPPH